MPTTPPARSPALALLAVAFGVSACAPVTVTAQARDRCDLSADRVFEAVRASVVSIGATSIDPYSPWDRVVRATGSGVVIDGDERLVLTNAHVIVGAQFVTVMLHDGTVASAEVVGFDPIYDLAVLRLEELEGTRLTAARFSTSGPVRVGQDVFTLGSPLGLRQTFSSGVVSAVDRVLPVAPFALSEPFIQTDAPINPGNSGGPLLNRCGEVVGINTAAIPGAQNIGFAVPSGLVVAIAPRLIEDGRVIRPWLGFQGQLVDPGIASLLRIPMVEGLLIEVTDPGGPAEAAGLRGGAVEVAVDGSSLLVGGDIVTRVNGRAVSDMASLVESLRPLEVGDSVALDVFRLGRRLRIEYRLPERPFLPGDMPGRLLFPTTGSNRDPPPGEGEPGGP